ncbi:MAG: hypothetical protein PHQ23_15225 [Candidatus Wallbacteria bacterium]|nr:hypothetical protein [Candidatus Wallbacteria bacterium]
MFHKYFSGTQKKAFLALAHKMVHADGKLADEERTMLTGMCREMNFDPCMVMKGFDLPQLLSQFDTRKSQVYLLLELIELEYADSAYSHQENELLGEILENFGFSQNQLLEMENWVFRHKELTAELDKFWK